MPVPYPPVPLGETLAEVPLGRVSATGPNDLVDGFKGVFISPAMEPSSGNEIRVDSLEVRALASDRYRVKQTPNPRPFLVGPPMPLPPDPHQFPPNISNDYVPVLNDARFCIINTAPNIVGIMEDTISGKVTPIVL